MPDSFGRASLIIWAGTLIFASPVQGFQEPPDSVIPLEPVVVRVLRSAVGTGAPYAVSVAGGEELHRGAAGAFLEDALRSLPGLQIQNRFNLASGERLAVRGFGSRAQFGIRGVRIFVDGIPATLPDGQTSIDHLDISGLARVELLRGPGASLYGNAAGGVLHFQSLLPSTEGMHAEIRTVRGSHGLGNYTGSLNGMVGDSGYRVGVSRFTYDGFRTDPVAQDGSVYGGAERTILNGSFSRALGGGLLRLVFNGLDMDAENAGSLSRALQADGSRQANRSNVTQRAHEDILQGQAGVTWSGTLAGMNAELSAWGIRREFVGRIPPRIVGFDRNAGGTRALFRKEMATGLGLLSIGGGGEVELQTDDRQNWENDGGERGDLTLDQLERVRSVGFFGQGRLDLDGGVAVLTGLRYDRFRFKARDRFLQDDTDDSGVRAMGELSPSIGVLWRPMPGLELFGSLATSFETPTTTELSNQPTGAGGLNPELDPTRGLTREGGFRAGVIGGWSLEGTFFRAELKKELVPFEVQDTPGRTFFRNAGSSYHQGWEATLEGRPADWAWLRVAYTRVDARYDSYTVEGEDFSGNRVPGLSPHRIDGRILLHLGRAFAEFRGLYQEAIPANDRNDASSPASLVADLRAGLNGIRAGTAILSPFMSLSNFLDRRYDAAVVVNAFGARFFEPGPGRTFQAGLVVLFRR